MSKKESRTLAAVLVTPEIEKVQGSPAFTLRYRRAFHKFVGLLQEAALTRGARQERLSGELFSFRIGKAARVLAVCRYIDGRPHWVLCDLLLNHEYGRKIENFNAGRVDAVLAAHSSKYSVPTEADEGAVAQAGGASKGLRPIKASIQNRQVIHRTSEQEECFQQLKVGLGSKTFVALVAGAGGTGKTVLASMLREWLALNNEKSIYIAESANLRRVMSSQWLQSSLCNNANREIVREMSYEELLRSLGLLTEEQKVVGDEHFKAFFEQEKSREIRVAQAGESVASGGGTVTRGRSHALLEQVSFEQFKQECCVMVDGLEEYLGLNCNNSLFQSRNNLRKRLGELFLTYQEALKEADVFNLNFYQPQTIPELEGQVIIVDESLDLSRFQLKTLVDTLPKLVMMGDLNQALADTSNTMIFLQRQVQKRSGYVVRLQGTHRCPQNVVKVGNALLRLKSKLGLRRSDCVDSQIRCASSDLGVGRVSVCNQLSEELKNQFLSVNTAVVCHPSRKKEVDGFLKTPLVFSVDEIKGLGYQRILVYDLLSKSAQDAIKTAKALNHLRSGRKLNRETIATMDIELIENIHGLYTAVTRSEVEVVFVQPKGHVPAVAKLLDALMAEVIAEKQPAVVEEVSTTAAWEEQQVRLLAAGNTEQAEAVRKHVANAEPKGVGVSKAAGGSSRPASAKQEVVDLIIRFKSYPVGSSGKKRKKKTKRVPGRAIDFAKPLGKEELAYLSLLPAKQLKQVQHHHALSFMFTKAHPDFKTSKKNSYSIESHLTFINRLKKIVVDISLEQAVGMLSVELGFDAVICQSLRYVDGRKFLYANFSAVLLGLSQKSNRLKTMVCMTLSGDFGEAFPMVYQVLKGKKPGLDALLDLACVDLHVYSMIEQYSSSPFLDQSTRDRILQVEQEQIESQSLEVVRKAVASQRGRLAEKYSDQLVMAAHNGEFDTVSTLLESRADINRCGPRKWSPLLIAAQGGHKKVVGLLLQHKANVNFENKERQTAAFVAASHGRQAVFDMLLNHGANAEQADVDGARLIFMAIKSGKPGIVRSLLKMKVDTNAPNPDGISPLMDASNVESPAVTRLLLDYKADPSYKGFNDRTALLTALRAGCRDVARLLLEYKASPLDATKDSFTAIYFAAQHGFTGILGSLLGAKASVNETGGGKMDCPLSIACYYGRILAAAFLLDNGAEINRRSSSGACPLLMAVQNGHVPTAQLLLDRKADLNQVNHGNETFALTIATSNSQFDMVEFLLDQGIGEAPGQIKSQDAAEAYKLALNENRPRIASSIIHAIQEEQRKKNESSASGGSTKPDTL
jgi:uncharacterized protein